VITFGSLFAGIGGFDLAFDRAGFRCAWQVEKDPAARSVLARHWPDVPRFDDVRSVGASNLAGWLASEAACSMK
jgi:DNA (cytosine-5)-methyltransferase 1